MTTKTALKARIADDLIRSDLTTQIGNAIDDAITHYKSEAFYFNQSRAATFTTVAAQSAYTVSDDADIPLFFQKEGVHIEVDSTDERQMEWMPQTVMEMLLGNSPASGTPISYSFFGMSFYLHPVPDDAYTIRVIGGIEVAGPASDAEAGNVWMTEAFTLLRARAKKDLYANVIMDFEKASVMAEAESQALNALRARTSKKLATGRIVPTQF